MFPPHMVDIDLIRSWMGADTEFLIDYKRLCIHVDPAKKVQVPTNSWLPNPAPTELDSRPDSPVQMSNIDELRRPEYEITSEFTDLTHQNLDDDSDENENNDIRKEASQRNRPQLIPLNR